MNGWITARLRLMMFLQFFTWGGWYATAGNFMATMGMSDVIYVAYLASPVGSIVAPFFTGMVADRFFSVQRVMGVMHLLSGAFLVAAPLAAQSGAAATPLFLGLLFAHMLCYMPTIGLATATAFHNLPDRERDFPLVRVFGTLGWIGAGFVVSYVLKGDTTGIPMYVAGATGVALGLYSFTLPDVPPPAEGQKVSFRDVLGLDALAHLRSRSFAVFIVCLALTSIPLATYYAYVPVFLRAADVADPAFKMTFGQMSEALFLLAMPWFLVRFGIKRVVVLGMAAWVVRYGLFALGAPAATTWMIMTGILLHGVCYDFVYVAGQIYLDRKAPRAIRAQAQGLFVLVSYGVGQGVGTAVAGLLFDRLMLDGAGAPSLAAWQTFWIAPVVFAAAVTLVFAFFFRDDAVVREAAAVTT